MALAVLVFDRTNSVAPDGRVLPGREVPAGAVRHRAHGPSGPASAAADAAGDLRHRGARVRRAGVPRRRRPLRAARSCSCSGSIDGTLAITGRGLTRGAVAALLQPRGLISRGQRADEPRLRRVLGVRRGARRRADRRLRAVSVALLVDAASFLMIAVWLADVARPAAARARGLPAVAPRASGRGLAFARSHRLVRTLLIGQSLALICFTRRRPDRGHLREGDRSGPRAPGFGVLLSAWGAGIVLGSLLVHRAQEPHRLRPDPDLHRRWSGSPTSACRRPGTLLVACLMSVVGGAGNGIQWVAVMTALQEATPHGLPGAHVRPAGVDRRGDAGRRLPARRPDRHARARRARRSPSPARGSSCWS